MRQSKKMLNELLSLRPDFFCLSQCLMDAKTRRCQFGFRVVTRVSGVAMLSGNSHVHSNRLRVVTEYLNKFGRESHTNKVPDKSMRHGVIVLAHLNVAVRMDFGRFPFCKNKRRWWQYLKMFFLFFKPLTPRYAVVLHCRCVQIDKISLKNLVEIKQRRENVVAHPGKERFLNDANHAFDSSLVMRCVGT